MPYAYFRVAAENLPLSEITQSLGVEPTESWKKGDSSKYNPSRPDSGWCLHSPLPKTNPDLQQHIEAVLDLLRPRHTAVQALSQKYRTYLVCTGKYDEHTSPGLFLSREALTLITSLGLSFDADLYFG